MSEPGTRTGGRPDYRKDGEQGWKRTRGFQTSQHRDQTLNKNGELNPGMYKECYFRENYSSTLKQDGREG